MTALHIHLLTRGNHMVPPRAPSFAVVCSQPVVGLSPGGTRLRPRCATDWPFGAPAWADGGEILLERAAP
jgi:hypothetical protein